MAKIYVRETEEKQEKKRFDRYPQYHKLSDEQKQEFKKALFLTKGAVNNNVGCMLASFGLSGEDIAKYGESWKDADNVDQGTILCTKHYPYRPSAGIKGRFTKKLLVQQAVRIPDLFDTIRGRALVAKYGDEVKDEFCDEQGRCSLSIVSKDTKYEKMLAGAEFVEGSATEYTFGSIKQDVIKEQNLGFDPTKAARLDFLEHTKASDIAKAKSKGIDLACLYARCMEAEQRASNGRGSLSSFPELNKDLEGLLEQDLSALANVSTEEDFKRKIRIPEEREEFSKALTTVACELGRYFIGHYYLSPDAYGASPKAQFSSLYIKAMYAAMDEMGVGLVSSSYMHGRGMLRTRLKRAASKVISLNEKYQKMLQNKSNKVEPAILRQTLVGMFNEFADRTGIEFRMFIREDRPAPTLAELFPTKTPKTAKAKVTRAPRKHSTGPKEVVEVEGVGTFVEY